MAENKWVIKVLTGVITYLQLVGAHLVETTFGEKG